MEKRIEFDLDQAENFVVVNDLSKFNFMTTNISDNFYFRRSDEIIDIGYRKIKMQGSCIIPIDILRVSWESDDGKSWYAPMIVTPQYKYIKTVFENTPNEEITNNYIAYMKKSCNLSKKESIEKVRQLLDYFNKSDKYPEIITLPQQKFQNSDEIFFLIYDGVHRASISKIAGNKNITVHIAVIVEPIFQE